MSERKAITPRAGFDLDEIMTLFQDKLTPQGLAKFSTREVRCTLAYLDNTGDEIRLVISHDNKNPDNFAARLYSESSTGSEFTYYASDRVQGITGDRTQISIYSKADPDLGTRAIGVAISRHGSIVLINPNS